MIVIVQGRKYTLETIGTELISVYDPSVDHEADLEKEPYGSGWTARFPMGGVLNIRLRHGCAYKMKQGESSDWRVEYPTVKTAYAYSPATDDICN